MNGKLVTMALAMLMLTTMFVFPFGTEEVRAADPPDGVISSWYTNWTITTPLTYHVGTRVGMFGWNVTIKNGGSLTLDNARIYMFGNFTSHIGVTVESGGTLTMLNSSRIYSSANGFGTWCDIQAGAAMDITNSLFRGCDGKGPNMTTRMGIHIAANNTRINATDISQVNIGIPNFMTIDGTGNKITNNSIFTDTTNPPIVLNNGNELSDNLMTRMGGTNERGIDIVGTGTTSLFNNQISGYIHGVYISSSKSQNVIAKGNQIYSNSNDGIHIDNGGASMNVTLQGNTIRNNGADGIYAYYSTLAMSQNVIHNNSLIGLNTNLVTLKSNNDKFADNPNYNLNLIHSTASIANATIARSAGITAGKSVLIDQTSNVTIRDSNIVTMMAASSNQIQVTGGSTAKFYNNFISNDWVLTGVYGASTAYFENNNFTTGMISVYGAEYSTIETKNNTLNNFMIGYGMIISASLVSNADTMWSTSVAGAAIVLDSSNAVVHDMRTNLFTNISSVVINPNGGSAELYDCTFNPMSGKVLVASAGHILSVSSSPTTSNVTVASTGVVDIGWYAEVASKWQNDATAPNATVILNDTTGVTYANVNTGPTGISPRAVVIQSTVDIAAIHSHNDYRASATLNGMAGTKTFTADKDLLGADKVVVNLNDNANPLINIVKPVDGLVTSNATVRINGTATDLGSDLAKIQLDMGAGFVDATGLGNWEYTAILPEGSNTITARALDWAGNIAAKTINVVVDLTAPTIVVTEPTGLYLRTGSFSINGTTEANSTITINAIPATVTGTSFTQTFTLADGDYMFVINATDTAGNKNSITKHYIVDTTPPDVSVDIADGTYFSTNAVTVTGWSTGDALTVNDQNVTIDPIKHTFSIAMTFVEGPNNVTAVASDLAGNTKTVDMVINVDTTPPVLTITAPGTPVTTNVKTLAIAGTVTGATNLMLGGAPLTFGTDGAFNTTVTLTEGENMFTLTAKDAVGNKVERTVTAILDDIAPVVTITSPASGLVTNAASVTVTGTVDDITAILTFGDLNVTNADGAFTFTSSLVNGTTTITIKATDLAGNVGEATITVTQDMGADLTVTGPESKEYKTKDDSVKISGTSEPGSKVYINDALVSDADGTYSYDWPLKPGENKITVRTVDPAGNEKSDTYTITKEKEEVSPGESIVKGTNDLMLPILLLIIGIVVGAIVGYAASRPKKQAPPVDEEPYTPARPPKGEPAPKFEPVDEEEEEAEEKGKEGQEEEGEEEKEEAEEEEPEEPPKKETPKAAPAPAPAPAPAKTEVKAAPKKEAPEPRPEPKPEPKTEAPKKEAPKKEASKNKTDADLDDILNSLK